MTPEGEIDPEIGIQEVQGLLQRTYNLLSLNGAMFITDGTLPKNNDKSTHVLSSLYTKIYKKLRERYRPYKLPEIIREYKNGESIVELTELELGIFLDKGTFLEFNRT